MNHLLDGVDLTNVILMLGIVGVIVTRVGEGRGWFRTAAGLRVENVDLLRRNQELEATVARHEIALAANEVRMQSLEQTIRDLEKLSQSAVLRALKDHEIGAVARAAKTNMLQSEANVQLERIAAGLETQAKGTP